MLNPPKPNRHCEPDPSPTAAEMVEAVEAISHLSREVFCDFTNRDRDAIAARTYLVGCLLDLPSHRPSLPEVSRLFGRQSHSTISATYQRWRRRRAGDRYEELVAVAHTILLNRLRIAHPDWFATVCRDNGYGGWEIRRENVRKWVAYSR